VVLIATIALARGEAATIDRAEQGSGGAPREIPAGEVTEDDGFGGFTDRLVVADSLRP
jgi:hypothetical protein